MLTYARFHWSQNVTHVPVRSNDNKYGDNHVGMCVRMWQKKKCNHEMRLTLLNSRDVIYISSGETFQERTTKPGNEFV